ncbi:iron export ABC transporter permease subunit FetB [Lactobacillus helveticus]|uniref:ABC transporter permease n=1 Tax=Lactobacillus helveticus TaxID=1587 RepID=UPI00081A9213|nr:iron export ABC transporter permease subunit FetB [Lactobacillus helveticus]ANZ56216.1 iron export ABC transporter permease subunit FetB [Lactobacillus helveticus]AQY54327.1 iron export ABC transporter permease subunit FetB [Lactobacillus helveticus]MBU6034221.1 iron export ABC transporter permease subunit FetB [Lactobacillus helveticus]MBW1219263.1 iron export ABC transporter permease subunit FetB [Lactobacillus helveticus]MDY0875647.1 iron export ABC transporter permease subunit FetB [Lac
MKNVMVSNLSLVLAFALVLVSIAISAKEKLGLTKDILTSVFRAIIQLVIIGFVLKFIFHVDQLWLTIVSTLVIIFNASWNANKRDPNPHCSLWNSIIAEAIGTYVTLALLIFSGVIKPIPMQVIPITGMIAGNEMVAIGLCYKALHDSFNDLHQQVLEKLALGSDIKLASMPILRRSIKTAMQPTIDSAKTVGLVNLPGMMSGLIFAGINPVYAIKYQIMITFMLLSATSLGAVISGYLAYKNYFNEQMQLR